MFNHQNTEICNLLSAVVEVSVSLNSLKLEILEITESNTEQRSTQHCVTARQRAKSRLRKQLEDTVGTNQG